ncbi:MAG: ATP-dependent Lon protease [Thermoanaerobaculia bacterium]|jgi:ATP-dependent Lon protease|nr:ATP-dependent Lon protease [Thermoanaerobaculia bacterium]
MAQTNRKPPGSGNAGEWMDEEIPKSLPIIPLVSSVLFPNGVLSLQVGIDRNVRLLKGLGEDQNLIAAFCQRTGDKENPRAEDLAPIGVLAAIVQRLPLSADRYQVFLQGRQRVELVQMLQNEPYFEGMLREVMPRPIAKSVKTDNLMNKAMSLFGKLVESDSKYSNEILNILRMNMPEGPDTFADLLSSFVNFPLEEKQQLLETVNPIERLELLVDWIQRDLGKATFDKELQRQIQTSIDRRDRENYLREQLRVIQDELGESNASEREADTYRNRVEALPLADEHKETLRREVGRLAQLSPSSSDYAVIKGHLDTVFQVPWAAKTEDRLDLVRAEEILDERHHGLEKVKERVLEFLAVLKLKGDLKGPILCFVGPPGVGKTSLGAAIADALGRKFVRMAVGGVTDESEIRGHRKTYIGAMPGKLIQSYIQVGVNNPLIMIDEIDKIGKDFRGDPASALLEVLDTKQNNAFVDRYLEIPYDLSHTLFISTANMLDTIPGPLRDRMEVIRLSGYTETEKVEIAKKHLIPELLESHGLIADQVTIDDDALFTVIRDYTAEAGVRNLERKIATILRKVARKVAGGEEAHYLVTNTDLEPYLGLPSFEHEFAERHPEVGVTTGLAWTQYGGEIMFIEATRMAGTGRTTVTGQLGDVMRESVTAAYSYVRSKAKDLEIDDKQFSESDIHIHFPAGGIPKDGPSAGVAIATCIASVMGERPVRHDVAMTGEITLRGKVLSVGGVKEKVMAAQRANIKTVVLPEGNRKDLTEVPEDVKNGLNFVFAARVEDVWKETLIPLYVARPSNRKYDEAEYKAEHQKSDRPEQR